MADEVTEEEVSVTGRSQMWKHEAMVEWIADEKGIDVTELSAAEVIAVAFAHRVEWRRSQTYVDLVESHAGEAEAAREERRQAKEAEKEARAAERAAKAAEKAAAKEAAKAARESEATEGKATAKATKATTAKKATKATRKATKAAPAEDPFA